MDYGIMEVLFIERASIMDLLLVALASGVI